METYEFALVTPEGKVQQEEKDAISITGLVAN